MFWKKKECIKYSNFVFLQASFVACFSRIRVSAIFMSFAPELRSYHLNYCFPGTNQWLAMTGIANLQQGSRKSGELNNVITCSLNHKILQPIKRITSGVCRFYKEHWFCILSSRERLNHHIIKLTTKSQSKIFNENNKLLTSSTLLEGFELFRIC